MKISIITVAFNSAATISNTIESVLLQTYSDIEYIVVDGNSLDATVDIIKLYVPKFNNRIKWISEPDTGIYDAMNKGIKMATGDIVGMLNSDDFYSSNDIIDKIALAFSDNNIGSVFGDIHFVKSSNLHKSVRRYSGRLFTPWMFRWGFMPPHPSFFVRKEFYDKWGTYDRTFDISGDYELMMRFLYVHKLPYKYLDVDMVAMRLGGASTKSIKSIIYHNNINIIRACRANGVYTNLVMVSVRYVFKILELIKK